MKVETIRAIENQVKDFLPIVRSLVKLFNSDCSLQVVELALSNIALNTEDCANYSIDRDIERINNTLELSKLMLKTAERDPSLKYILENFISIVEGNLFMEDYE